MTKIGNKQIDKINKVTGYMYLHTSGVHEDIGLYNYI